MDQAIFNNLSAWFSRSVSSRRKTLWVKHGGKLADVRDAQFIFSQDVENWDTKSLFQTEDYLIGCLTVFHAGFIDACLKSQSAHKTPVSRYLLLPKDTPKVLHSIVIPVDTAQESIAGRQIASSSTARLRENSPPTETAAPPQDANTRDPLPEGGIYANHYSCNDGNRLISAPIGNGTAVCSEAGKPTVTDGVQRSTAEGTEGGTRDECTDSPVRRQFCVNLENPTGVPNFQNLDVSKIPHVRDLPKVAGPIVDFVIGRNGFGVQKNT